MTVRVSGIGHVRESEGRARREGMRRRERKAWRGSGS